MSITFRGDSLRYGRLIQITLITDNSHFSHLQIDNGEVQVNDKDLNETAQIHRSIWVFSDTHYTSKNQDRQLLSIFFFSLLERVYSEGKGFALFGSKFFPFQVDTFSEGSSCTHH